MGHRWALYIDIEGFGVKWNDTTAEAFRGINALMQGIFWIGDRYYRDPPDRLFANQFGDGFLVTSDSHEEVLDRPVLCAVALLRHLLTLGETAKCAIAEGEIADIKGCYPSEVRDQLSNGNIHFGSGVMTISPVMGSALINAVSIQKQLPSGPLIGISSRNASRISCGAVVTNIDAGVASIDWLKGEPRGLEELQAASRLKRHAEVLRSEQLRGYLASNTHLSERWKDNAQKYLL
jgi:hypothetical protein